MAHQSDDSSSSDDDTGPALPLGVLRSRGGWEDANNIEMEHQREKLRAAAYVDERNDGSRAKAPSHAAVDLAQFRNEEVGKGYQARHVVRQREASSSSATGVVDMSGGKFSRGKERGAKAAESSSVAWKRQCDDDGADSASGRSKKDDRMRPPCTEDMRLESYLKCKGMRDFMKDIDQILKQ
mmetsp:Transcript_35430/g.75640  ORF Transcript_35430/g.75640 Transcript_35430/m.75640 type:complete len:182 (-) Transcript_35430:1943-2488(-)